LQAAAPDDGSIVLLWKLTSKLIGYQQYLQMSTVNVYRGADKLVSLPITGSPSKLKPLSYIDTKPPQGRSVSYHVTVTGSDGRESQPSATVTITPVQFSQVVAPTGTGSQSDSGSLDLIAPNFQGKNAPTACEEYCGVSAGDINNTYGAFDNLVGAKMAPLTALWKGIVVLNFVALTLLAWTVTKNLYRGVVTAVTFVVQTIFSMSLYHSLVGLVMVTAGLCLALLAVTGRLNLFKRQFGLVAAALLLSTLFSMFAPTVVSDALTAPTTIGQGILGVAGELTNKFSSNSQLASTRYNISIKPTYSGGFEQGVRRFQDAEFLNTVYAGTCKETFGDFTWSWKHYVPDRTANPQNGFHNLTYCEYYFRARKLGIKTEQNYLQSMVEANAPPYVWNFYQGQNPDDHWGYMWLIGPATSFRTLLIFLTGYVFAVCIFALGYMLVKATVLLLGWAIPPLENMTTRIAKQMVIKFGLPPFMAAGLVIGLIFSTIAFNTVGLLGWDLMMAFQVISALASFLSGYLVWRSGKKATAAIRREPRVNWQWPKRTDEPVHKPAHAAAPMVKTSPRPGRGGQLAATATKVAVAGYSGGASAVVGLATTSVRTRIGNVVSGRREQRAEASMHPPTAQHAASTIRERIEDRVARRLNEHPMVGANSNRQQVARRGRPPRRPTPKPPTSR